MSFPNSYPIIFPIMASLPISFLSYYIFYLVLILGRRNASVLNPGGTVPLTRTLYYKLGSDDPVFPSLRSASQSVSQLASQPVVLDCLRAMLHILNLASYVALECSMLGLGAGISQAPLFFLCPPTVDAVGLPG